ncbi:cation:proton antiporter [Bacillus sp. DX4.1]|uniref:cation:proton antiporter n=1 Tax=Bacillus sp. DX4.1 TaxID=3055867 RepID=UPI0025A1F8AE|nr:cation:proton antiporter [Bacillus sp. DX4.1]MDM5187009.1 cation:proton antiporter [Bacillus sp. DX4.1]
MFIFLISLSLILLVSQLMGFLAKLVGQPKVVGEMIGGVIIGPTFLGTVFPELQTVIFKDDNKETLYLLSQLGISLYMFLIGTHVGKEPIAPKEFNIAIKLALFGIIPTFIAIFLFSWNFYYDLEIKLTSQLVYALFMAASISITAFPVLVRILDQYKMINTSLGKTVVLSASIDDAIAWILLPIIIALSKFNFSLNDINILFYMIFYLLVMFFIIKPIIAFLTSRFLKEYTELFPLFILVFLISSLITEKIGLHCIFGGFIAGLIMPRNTKINTDLNTKLSGLVNTLFIPIFFVLSGFNVDLNNLTKGYSYGTIALFILIAFTTKYFSCMLYSKMIGFNWNQSSAIGALMNARGLMILIFANIGLTSKLISNNDYCILFLIAIITTIFTSPLFKISMYFQKNKQSYEIEKTHIV